MYSRSRRWRHLLWALLLLPFVPAVLVFFWGRGGGAQEEKADKHSELFRQFHHQMKDLAANMDCTLEQEGPDSETYQEYKSRFSAGDEPHLGGTGSKDVKGVVFEFRTTDPGTIDEFALQIEKELSRYTADQGALPQPTRELWPGETGKHHMQSFEFSYKFPDRRPGGLISGDIEIGVGTSRVIIHIAEDKT
jgi:hypothetical protein